MAGAPDEHAKVSGKGGLRLFCPPARSMKIFASFPKIMIIDTTEMPYRTGICETLIFVCFWTPKCNLWIYMI